jgi:hypothetical protein
MTCRIRDYGLGVKGPQDILPYCEGDLVQLMKQRYVIGTAGESVGAEFPPPEGGPGGCKTVKECIMFCAENYDECVEWTENHPAYWPPPSEEEIERMKHAIETGRFSEGMGPGPPRECFEDGTFIGFDECEKIMRERFSQYKGIETRYEQSGEFGVEYRGGEFPPTPPGFYPPTASGEQCSGCLNNNICDPAECSFCPDCQK